MSLLDKYLHYLDAFICLAADFIRRMRYLDANDDNLLVIVAKMRFHSDSLAIFSSMIDVVR